MTYLMVVDNEVVEVTSINGNGFGGYYLDCDNGCEYHMFEDHDAAGEAAKEYWKDMAEHDREEFKCLIGADNLIAWCLGEYAGPGTSKVPSLQEWFDLWLDTPEEQWASYDGEEIEGVPFNKNLEYETGFDNRDSVVLYRWN